jgi:ribosomal protein S8
MIINDAIADVIARINTGIRLRRNCVVSKKSIFIINFLKILVQEGYLQGYVVEDDSISIFLKYLDGACVIRKLVKISTISRKYHLPIRLRPLRNKYIDCTYVISTSQGIIAHHTFPNISGEILCLVY